MNGKFNATGVSMQKVSVKNWSLIEEKSHKYPAAFLTFMSAVCLQKWTPESLLETEELLEARFFGEKGELHVFQGEDGWEAVELIEEEGAEYLDRKAYLSERFQELGTTLITRQYLAYDEDGQAYVALSRLYRGKGGEIE